MLCHFDRLVWFRGPHQVLKFGGSSVSCAIHSKSTGGRSTILTGVSPQHRPRRTFKSAGGRSTVLTGVSPWPQRPALEAGGGCGTVVPFKLAAPGRFRILDRRGLRCCAHVLLKLTTPGRLRIGARGSAQPPDPN